MDEGLVACKPWDQVFTLPELVEPILINLGDEPPPCLDLWTLQRANRLFKDIICRSRTLQEHKLLTHKGHEDGDAFRDDLPALTWIVEFMPFTIPRVQERERVQVPPHPGWVTGTMKLFINDPEADKHRPNEERVRRFKHQDASWRHMKILRYGHSVRLCLALELYDYQARFSCSQVRARSAKWIDRVTLGDLFDVVDRIRRRSPEEHFELEKRSGREQIMRNRKEWEAAKMKTCPHKLASLRQRELTTSRTLPALVDV